MARESCITHLSSDVYVKRRKGYTAICEGNTCAAELLDLFEYWTNCKLERVREIKAFNETAVRLGQPTASVPSTWLYERIQDLKEALIDGFAETSIKRSLKFLKEKGFIEDKQSPTKFDNTKLYRLCVEKVQLAVNNWHNKPTPETLGNTDETKTSDDQLKTSHDETESSQDETFLSDISNTLSNTLSKGQSTSLFSLPEEETPVLIESTDSLEALAPSQHNPAAMDINPDDSKKVLAARDNSTSQPKHNRQGDKYFGQVRQENYQRSLAARLQRTTIPIEEREPWGNVEVFKAFEAHLLEQAKKWEKCQNPASYVASKLQKIASGDAAKTEFDDWHSRYLVSKQPATSIQVDTPSLTPEQEAWVAIAKEIQMVSEAAHVTVTFHRELWQVTSNFGDMNGTLGAVMERVPLAKLPVRFKAWYSECYQRALQNAPHLRLPAPLQPQKRAG